MKMKLPYQFLLVYSLIFKLTHESIPLQNYSMNPNGPLSAFNATTLLGAVVDGKPLCNLSTPPADATVAASAISMGARVGLGTSGGFSGFYVSAPGHSEPSEFRTFNRPEELAEFLASNANIYGCN
jgi:hypothetical protein